MVRVKFRHILLEIVWDDFGNEVLLELPITSKSVHVAVKKCIEQLYGDYGIAVLQLGMTIKLFNPYTRLVLIKARRGPHKMLCTAVPFVKTIYKNRCCLRLLHVAGTLRSTNKFLRTYFRQELVAILQKCSSDEEKSEVQKAIATSLKRVNDEGSQFQLPEIVGCIEDESLHEDI